MISNFELQASQGIVLVILSLPLLKGVCGWLGLFSLTTTHGDELRIEIAGGTCRISCVNKSGANFVYSAVQSDEFFPERSGLQLSGWWTGLSGWFAGLSCNEPVGSKPYLVRWFVATSTLMRSNSLAPGLCAMAAMGKAPPLLERCAATRFRAQQTICRKDNKCGGFLYDNLSRTLDERVQERENVHYE